MSLSGLDFVIERRLLLLCASNNIIFYRYGQETHQMYYPFLIIITNIKDIWGTLKVLDRCSVTLDQLSNMLFKSLNFCSGTLVGG